MTGCEYISTRLEERFERESARAKGSRERGFDATVGNLQVPVVRAKNHNGDAEDVEDTEEPGCGG